MVNTKSLAARAAESIPDMQTAANALATAIRKPVDALEKAADEAARGMIGPAKLGLLVATKSLIDAFEAVDAEFARRSGSRGTADESNQRVHAPHGKF
jgi:hypothetical protein